jgi:nickel-dependent lactate racemase
VRAEELPRLERTLAPALTAREVEEAWRPVLRRMRRCRGEVTLVVNDAARAPLRPVIEPVEGELAGRVRTLVAVGTHRRVGSDELARLVGEPLSRGAWRCAGDDGYVAVGKTPRGTRIEVDPWVVGSSLVVTVNSVEPHYFAGFTGGRKSLMPGCCSRASAEDNHFLALSDGSAPGRLRGNPVHSDMTDALEIIAERTGVMGVNGVIFGGIPEMLAAPDPAVSFTEAVAHCRSRLPSLEGRRLRCAVLRPGGALGVSLYQSMKAIYNWQAAMEDGAAVLLDSPCPEGLGAGHMVRTFAMASGGGYDVCSREEYSLGLHAAGRLGRAMERMELFYHGGLDRDLASGLGLRPVSDVEGWLEARACLRPVLVPRAGMTCPAEAGL